MGRKIIRSLLPVLLLVPLYLMMNSYVRSMIYPAPSFRVPQTAPEPFQDVWLSGKSGAKVHGWYFQTGDAAEPVLVHFHGNGENLETLRLSGFLESLMRLNVSIFAIDYPGYGRSEGKSSEESIREASMASLNWVKEKHPNSKLIACGWSLGAAVAIDLASRHASKVDGLIAISAWTSLNEVAKKHFPSWMVKLLLQESYDSLNAATKVQCPSLIIHGEEDTLIPVEHGKSVANAFQTKKQLVLVPAAGHNDLLDYPRVWQEMAAYLMTVTYSK